MAIRPIQSNFSVSITHYGVRLLLCLMASLVCLILIYWPNNQQTFITPFATLILTVLVWLVVHYFRLMFGMKPALEMNEIGITDRRNPFKTKFISWQNISACEIQNQVLIFQTNKTPILLSCKNLKSNIKNIQKATQRFIDENKIDLASE
jgi:hypothetical protein